MVTTKNKFTSPDCVVIASAFNNAEVITPFLERLESSLSRLSSSFLVLVIDNASTDHTKEHLVRHSFSAPNLGLRSIHLPEPRSEHEVIAQGLSVARQLDCQQFIVMQANGEDDPAAIPALLEVENKDVVFVDKGPRADNLFFWVVYRLYQAFFWILTGREINVGIYSLINRKTLDQLNRKVFLHYTAHLYRNPFKRGSIRFEHKTTHKSFAKKCRDLFSYGIRSLMEFGEDLLTVFLKLALFLGFLLFVGVLSTAYIKLFTTQELPDWSIFALVALFNGLLFSIGFFAVGIMSLNRLRTRDTQEYAFDLSQESLRDGISATKAVVRKPLSLN